MSVHTEKAKQLLDGAAGHDGPQQVRAACYNLLTAIEWLEERLEKLEAHTHSYTWERTSVPQFLNPTKESQ